MRRGGRASKKSGANCVPTGGLRWVRTPHRRGRGAGAAGPVGACVAPDARANTGPHGQACAHHSDHCDPEGRGGPRKRPFFDHFRRPGPRQADAPARPEAGWMWGDPRDAVPPRIAIGRRWNGVLGRHFWRSASVTAEWRHVLGVCRAGRAWGTSVYGGCHEQAEEGVIQACPARLTGRVPLTWPGITLSWEPVPVCACFLTGPGAVGLRSVPWRWRTARGFHDMEHSLVPLAESGGPSSPDATTLSI